MTIEKQAPNKFYNSLQIYRGIAALMVVFHHQWGAFEYFYNLENLLLNFIAAIGKYGVDFFFVLSGFIITYSNYNKSDDLSNTHSFLMNRVLRIYLPYLPISVAMILLYTAFPSVSESGRSYSILTSLTLAPDGNPALSVAWTLIHEMMFYVLFIGWFISRKAWFGFTIIWTFFIIYLNYYLIHTSWQFSPFVKFFGSTYNLAFILGSYSAILLKKAKIVNRPVFLFVGSLILFFAIYLKWQEIIFFNSSLNLILSVSFALIVLGSINSNLDNINPKGLWMLIGNASYSIYLVHNPEISLLARILPKFLSTDFAAISFIIIFIACCITGILYSKIFEEYLLNTAKNKIFPKTKKKMVA